MKRDPSRVVICIVFYTAGKRNRHNAAALLAIPRGRKKQTGREMGKEEEEGKKSAFFDMQLF